MRVEEETQRLGPTAWPELSTCRLVQGREAALQASSILSQPGDHLDSGGCWTGSGQVTGFCQFAYRIAGKEQLYSLHVHSLTAHTAANAGAVRRALLPALYKFGFNTSPTQLDPQCSSATGWTTGQGILTSRGVRAKPHSPGKADSNAPCT